KGGPPGFALAPFLCPKRRVLDRSALVRPMRSVHTMADDESPRQGQRSPFAQGWILLLLLLAGLWIWRLAAEASPAVHSISYTSFYDLVERGKVKSVTISGQDVTGKLEQPETIEG